VPRNVDPALGRVPGLTLVDIDALRPAVAAGERERSAAVPQAERIVEEEVAEFSDWMREAAARDAIRPLCRALEAVCRREVAYALRATPQPAGWPPATDRAEVERPRTGRRSGWRQAARRPMGRAARRPAARGRERRRARGGDRAPVPATPRPAPRRSAPPRDALPGCARLRAPHRRGARRGRRAGGARRTPGVPRAGAPARPSRLLVRACAASRSSGRRCG
jgi:hypothetical protein